jgi:hypothetical protein
LPPEPDFLFEKIEIESEESWEITSEADEEYHDTFDGGIEVKVTLSEAAPSIILKPQPLGSTSMDEYPQSKH